MWMWMWMEVVGSKEKGGKGIDSSGPSSRIRSKLYRMFAGCIDGMDGMVRATRIIPSVSSQGVRFDKETPLALYQPLNGRLPHLVSRHSISFHFATAENPIRTSSKGLSMSIADMLKVDV
jgi:hypothetical protein